MAVFWSSNTLSKTTVGPAEGWPAGSEATPSHPEAAKKRGGTTTPEGRRRLRDAKRTVGSLPEGPLGGLYTPPHKYAYNQIRPKEVKIY